MRFSFVHAVYMNRYMVDVRDLDELTVEQRRFLGGVAARIPRLIEAIQEGATTARFKLGTRRLDDGRHLEVELVARIPEDKWHGVARSWGQIPPEFAGGRGIAIGRSREAGVLS